MEEEGELEPVAEKQDGELKLLQKEFADLRERVAVVEGRCTTLSEVTATRLGKRAAADDQAVVEGAGADEVKELKRKLAASFIAHSKDRNKVNVLEATMAAQQAQITSLTRWNHIWEDQVLVATGGKPKWTIPTV